MASSSNTFGFVSLVLLSFFLVSASASTKIIDAICRGGYLGTEKAICTQILKAYPPVASATDKMQAVLAVFRLAKSHAAKSAALAGKAAKANPNLKKQFEDSQQAFLVIKWTFTGLDSELKEDPTTANYDVAVCYDQTRIVKTMCEKNTDKASRNVMKMTLMMDNLIGIAVDATVAVGG